MFKHRYAAVCALSLALAVLAPAGADAASLSATTIRVGDVSFSHAEVETEDLRFARALSSHYHRSIPASEVVRLRADFDLGFGDISVLYALVDHAGVPGDELARLRGRHLGWGEIAKLYGVKVKDLKRHHDLFADEARGRGIEIRYIEVDGDNGPEGHGGAKARGPQGHGRK